MVGPTCLDERHHSVANDCADALELSTRLDRFLAGVDKALALVRMPTEAEEQARARERAIVAFARQQFVDLWRWKTGRRPPQQLGWVRTAD